MPISTGRYSVGVKSRHTVTMRNELLIESIRRIRIPRHQVGAQYSEAECTRAKVAVRKVVAPAPQLIVPAKGLIKEALKVSFLRIDSRCCRYVSNLSRVKPRCFGVAQKGGGLPFRLTSTSRFVSLLLR